MLSAASYVTASVSISKNNVSGLRAYHSMKHHTLPRQSAAYIANAMVILPREEPYRYDLACLSSEWYQVSEQSTRAHILGHMSELY